MFAMSDCTAAAFKSHYKKLQNLLQMVNSVQQNGLISVTLDYKILTLKWLWD